MTPIPPPSEWTPEQYDRLMAAISAGPADPCWSSRVAHPGAVARLGVGGRHPTSQALVLIFPDPRGPRAGDPHSPVGGLA